MLFLFYLFNTAFLCSAGVVNECYEGYTKNYTGQQSWTYSYYPCHRWDSNASDIDSTWDFSSDGSIEAASNYCRDPDSSGFLWCFSENPDIEKEICEIGLCFGEVKIAIRIDDDLWRCRPKPITGCIDMETEKCYKRLENGECEGLGCCVNRGCMKGHSSEYDGTWRHTYIGNEECMSWESVAKFIDLDLEAFPDDTLADAGNYCRDPESEGKLVCYVRDGTKNYCGIPSCSLLANRHLHNHDCYNITWTDIEQVGLPDDATDKQVCESLPNKFYLESPSEDFPGCQGCTCCQLKDCYDEDPSTYRGTWSRTRSGRVCERWEDMHPFYFTTIEKVNTSLDNYQENYCRTQVDKWSDGSPYGVACFVKHEDYDYRTEESCDIPKCHLTSSTTTGGWFDEINPPINYTQTTVNDTEKSTYFTQTTVDVTETTLENSASDHRSFMPTIFTKSAATCVPAVIMSAVIMSALLALVSDIAL